jgi:aminoglycoside phosphotransferase (APT) family kinase protein
MTFKQNWEKTEQQISLPNTTIETMLKLAFPNKKLSSYSIISGGCANLNVKIILEKEDLPFILRVYLRDKNAAYREQTLGTLLKQTVPLPQVYFIGNCEEYRFALTEFISGITLRELLLSKIPHDIGSIMFQVGQMLAEIQAYRFSEPGFFDNNLKIIETLPENAYLVFAEQSLIHPTVSECLGGEIITRIKHYFNALKRFFPHENESHLVHADFDPANILVDKVDDEWVIAGVLDWEFAFSGSPLWDMANMLRYSHQMPALFETSFIQGLATEFILPRDWKTTIYLLNVMSLLDCLTRCTKVLRPKQCADITMLINYFDKQLSKLL